MKNSETRLLKNFFLLDSLEILEKNLQSARTAYLKGYVR